MEPPKAVSSKLPPVTRSTAAPQEQKAAATVASSVPAPPISKPESKAAPKSAPAPVVAAPAKPEKPVIPKDLAELERAVENAATQAVKEYNKAVLILKSYNDDVKKIVDSAVENIDVNAWTALKNKTLTRDTAVEAAEQAALAARKKLNELEQQVDKNVVEISGDVKTALKHSISSFNDHLNAAKVEVLKAKELAGTSENYWKKVESARGYFVKEIESLFGVNLNEKKLNLSKDDIDLFLVNAYSHVMAYQKELHKIQTEGELRLRRALDAVRGSDQTESVKAQLEYELEKERRNLNLQNQTKVRHCTIIWMNISIKFSFNFQIFKIKAETERSLREQLKKQIEAHTDHLNDAIAQKEAEMKRLFARELDEKVADERASYNTQLAAMLGKLKGMDSALKGEIWICWIIP